MNTSRGEGLFARADYLDSIACKLLCRGPFACLNILVRDYMKAIAEQGNSPTLGVALEHVGGALRLVDDEFK